jgi:hypothetical protein
VDEDVLDHGERPLQLLLDPRGQLVRVDDGQVPVEAAVEGDGQPFALAPDEDIVAAISSGDGVRDGLDPRDERALLGRDVPAAPDPRPSRFDVGVDPLDGRQAGPEVLLDVAGQVVGLVEEEVVVDLEVEIDVDSPPSS